MSNGSNDKNWYRAEGPTWKWFVGVGISISMLIFSLSSAELLSSVKELRSDVTKNRIEIRGIQQDYAHIRESQKRIEGMLEWIVQDRYEGKK